MLKRYLCAILVLFPSVLGTVAPDAHAALFREVALGVGTPFPLTSTTLTTNRLLSYEGQFLLDDSLLTAGLFPKFSFFYSPTTVRNLNSATLQMGGATVGLQVRGSGFWKFSPSFSLEGGAMYEALQFTGVSNGTANTAVVWMAQSSFSLDVSLFYKLGLVLRESIQFFGTRPLQYQWNGMVLLRWDLG